MADKKVKLLRSLTIDRSDGDVTRSRLRPWVAFALGTGFVILNAASLRLFNPIAEVGGRSDALSATQASLPAHPPTQPEPPASRSFVASGYVVARRKATVAAEVTGKVVEVRVDEGMLVSEGQVLARLDSVLAERDLALAKARARGAEAAAAAIAADLRDAERIFARVQNLSQRNVASQADLTKAEARVGVLRAQLQQTQAQIESALLDAQRTADLIEKHQIRAPFSGVVVDRNAQPGEMISPMSAGGFTRTGICTIVDMDSIEIEVDVNEAFIGRLHAGIAVSAVLDAYPDWTIPASVIAIVPTANREKATVRVRIGLQQKDPRILPDMAVKVSFLNEGISANVPDGRSTAAN
jgi:RND family efflux transporter MFP subunit